jgi:hypothetical protein
MTGECVKGPAGAPKRGDWRWEEEEEGTPADGGYGGLR